MNTEIATLDLNARRRLLLGYALGMAAYVLVIVVLYPAFKGSTDLDKITKSSPNLAALFGIVGSLTSPTGWLSANIYANFFPLIILLLTIGYGASCIAGQEADGHLELVLSLPFSRAQVVLQKEVALAVQAIGFSVVVFLSVLVGRAFQVSFDTLDVATTTLGVALLGIAFGYLAVVIGSATGERGLAIGIASAVAAASYLISSMAPVVSWVDRIKYVSLFYWCVGDNQLEHGLSLLDAVVLVAVSVVLGAVAVRRFEHHNVS